MTDAPDRRPTVVIIEDEAVIAMLLMDSLAEAGYRAVWSPSGGGVWAGLRPQQVPDAAVVDLRLAHGLDGREVVRRLREQCPGMPIVVVTDLDRAAPGADLRGLGGPMARLCKPLERGRLLGHLDGTLRAADTAPPRARRASDAAMAAE